MPSFELVSRRVDVEQREYPVGYRFPPSPEGVVWVVTDVVYDGDVVRHICRVEADGSKVPRAAGTASAD